MKTLPIRLALALVCLLTGVAARGQDLVGGDLEPIRVQYNLPGLSAMVVKDSRIVAQGVAGYRRQGDPTPLRITDPINLASCTKFMTATLAARLVERGVISWGTRVRDIFPDHFGFNTAYWDVTLAQILAHRGGIEDEGVFTDEHYADLLTQTGTIMQIRRWVAETVLKDAPEVTPGTFLYSTQGYAVAAAMLEIATGKDWETLLREEVLLPANMTTAIYGPVFDDALPPKAPVGHDLDDGQTVPVPEMALDAATNYCYEAAEGPGGYVACTLEDWAKFLTLHTADGLGTYLSADTEAMLETPYDNADNANYALGVYSVARDWATPGNALHHVGIIFGHDTVVWMAPGRDFIVLVFTNCTSGDDRTSDALDDVANLLIERYSGGSGLMQAAVSIAGPLLGGYGAPYSPPGFFRGATVLDDDRTCYLAFPDGNFFGYYGFLSDPHYIYHDDLGYEYVFDAADGQNGVYLYDFKSQTFFYTSPTFSFPYLYDFSLNTTLYYYPDPNHPGHYNTNGVRYFYDFATGHVITK